jgi:hypothetical protein
MQLPLQVNLMHEIKGACEFETHPISCLNMQEASPTRLMFCSLQPGPGEGSCDCLQLTRHRCPEHRWLRDQRLVRAWHPALLCAWPSAQSACALASCCPLSWP